MSESAVTLRLTDRRGIDPPRDGDRLVLAAESSWMVRGPSGKLQIVEAALPGVCEAFGDDLLVLNFGNSVGRMELPGLGAVEVVSAKGGAELFDRMLADLSRVAAQLPFSADTATAMPYDRSVVARRDILYHAFVYLRHILSDGAPTADRLLPALEAVLREPHRRFERDRHTIPIGQATRVDGGSLLSLATQGDLENVRSAGARRSPLVRALGGRVPRTIREVRIESTFDTAENRYVKSFLSASAGVIEGMREAVRRERNQGAFSARVVGECDAMERRLRPIQLASLWAEVGPMVHVPVASTVLQRRRGYREVFRHSVRLRLASRIPLAADVVRALLEVKDIALLYELWCYFRVVDELGKLLGPPDAAASPVAGAFALTVPWDLGVSWGRRARLYYNARFSRCRANERRSYSVPLRPDIVLEVGEGTDCRVHLLDAKFRLDRIEQVLSSAEGEDDVTETEERQGTFRRGDLYKMHAYRDAIPGAASVWILYPGSEFEFFEASGVRHSAPTGMGSRPKGVGAIPLSPSGDSADFRITLAALLERQGQGPQEGEV
ncbi:MAG: DUF2357 domain-containing protein [Chloroflexi bacterium]|nr:DUF2357 domain-containing protein [Chloroflexota bacterium]